MATVLQKLCRGRFQRVSFNQYIGGMFRLAITALILFTFIDCFAQKKISQSLQQAIEKKTGDEIIDVSFYTNSIARTEIEKICFQLKAIGNNFYTALIRVKNIAIIASDPGILYIDAVQKPQEELSTGINDLTLNKINFIQHLFSSLRGDSINISVKERLFDTTDIDLKGRVFKTGFESASQTAHASLMATIIGGAGNSSPFSKGVAIGSRLSSANFANLFPEPDSFYHKNKITVQNHSYGTVIENVYGNEAAAFDKAAITNPSLVFVFSSGNSGTATTTSGPYANVQGYANLTGNFKHSKNSIVVGATDSLNVMQGASSKGPTHDGRVKPELVAFGEDGSSGAAALVSGTASLIQDAYKRMHSQLPPSSLVKAVLINSADDAAVPNVDYASGYGSLNAYKAVQTVKNNLFFNDSVANNGVKSFSISVPANVAKLKVTLVWNDPAALPNASKALINDLDVVLKNNATLQSWAPWVLNYFPHKDSLQLAAQRKRDTLNNVEQITLDNPTAGNYTIEVTAARVTTSTQSFSVAYQFDTANTFYFTYPTASDPLISRNGHIVRWQTTKTGSGILEYATNASNWRPIASIPDISVQHYKWQLPDTVTLSQLRLRTGSDIFLSDTFTISPQLTLDVGFNCVDSFLLYWNKLPGTQYKLYELTDKYLQAFQQTSDTSVILKTAQHPSIFYAVAPLIGNKEGIRTNTLNYVSQANGCYIRSFFLQTQATQSATLRAEIGTVYNVVEVALEKKEGSQFITLQTIAIPNVTVFNLTDAQLKQGENIYRFRVKLSNGTILYSNTELVYHFADNVPVVIYPNPALQTQKINIINNESGRYTIQIIDESGRIVYTQLLTATLTQLPANILGKGLYIIRIHNREGKASTQKLVIY